VFVFLVVVKWWFWPWYLIWLVPLAALLPRGRSALVATVFSLSAMLSYVVFFWQAYSDWAWQQTTTALTVLVAPVVVALIPYPLHRRLWPIREDAGAGVEHEPA
jgi:hypothetical protein